MNAHDAKIVLLALLTLLLAACGGGGGGAPRDTTLPDQTVSTTYTINASLRDAAGHAVTVLTEGVGVTGVAQVTENKTITTPGQASPGAGPLTARS